MRDIQKRGRKRASEKTDEAARAELGDHLHSGTEYDFFGNVSSTNGQAGSGQTGGTGNGQSEAKATTWEAFDLGPYLRGEIERPEPSLGLARSDGLRPLYHGREHAVLGETESGRLDWR